MKMAPHKQADQKKRKNTSQNKNKKGRPLKKKKVVLDIPQRGSAGKLFVCGCNEIGQLGLDEEVAAKRRPFPLNLDNICDIAAGGMHSVCLTDQGSVITFGCNDEGALGRITAEESLQYTPGNVEIPEPIVQISAGDSHSAALSESGHVYVWGNFRNDDGGIGLITPNTIQSTPVQILHNKNIVKIASGENHLVCLSDDGYIFTCGSSSHGQLGRFSSYQINGGRAGLISLLTPLEVTVGRVNATNNNIWTGTWSTYVRQNDGKIYAFGLNNYGQLGTRNEGPNIIQNAIWKPAHMRSFDNRRWSEIQAGQHHALALEENGAVYSLGLSTYGRLGLGETSEDRCEPTAIPSLKDTRINSVACGDHVSFAVENNGSAYSWGMGTNEQLGHGNDNDENVPRLIEGKFLESWKAIKISGGGQHTLILAQPKDTS